MRLTTDQIQAIRQTAQRVLGAHLQYTHRTLFAQPIDAAWVRQLTTRDDLSEKINAFVSRFGRLLIPANKV